MISTLRSRYYAQPHEVSIETLATCNAACTFCPYPTLERQHARLSDEVLHELFNQMACWSLPFFISPFKVNEPLLDPRIRDLCRLIELRIPQAKLRLFTNGSPLTDHHVEWISRLKRLDRLWISLNSCDPEEYRRLMGLNYFITERRLNALHDAVKSGEFKHEVMISRVMSSKTLEPDCRDSAFKSQVAAQWPYFKVKLIKRDGWLGYVEPNTDTVPQVPCARWFEMNITAQGKAVLCCMDGQGEYELGDVTRQTLLAIYNQADLKKRRLHALTREGIDPCARCTY